MTNTITLREAKSQWDTLIAKIGLGEEWLITNPDGQPIAKLVPAVQAAPSVVKEWDAIGMMRGQIEIAPDFDEPLDDFKPYME